MSEDNWTLYLLENTSNNKTYVGVTTDINRRIKQHNGELSGGAKYTKANRGDGEWIVRAKVTELSSSSAHSYENKIKNTKNYNKKITPIERRLIIMTNLLGKDTVEVINYDENPLDTN